jgi:hypothetical protein
MGKLWGIEKIMLKYSLFKGFFYANMNNNPYNKNILHIGKI